MKDTSNNARIFVIGLDGGTFDLILPWAEKGYLPNLRNLMETGAWGNLQSTLPPHSAPAWSSFATGTHPGKHGVYTFFGQTADSYLTPVNSHSTRQPTLWQLLNAEEKAVGIMNVPVTYPPQVSNGFMISGLLSPSTKLAFHPPALHDELLSRFPNYSVELPTKLDRREYAERSLRSIETRLEAALYLMGSRPWDFFMVVFTELDRLQHFYWADMDPSHPNHVHLQPDGLQDTLLEAYSRLDRAIGQIQSALPEDAAMFVVSDHGFAPVYRAFHVNVWLRREGLLSLRDTRLRLLDGVHKLIGKLGLVSFLRTAQQVLPVADKLRSANAPFEIGVDWTRTRAFFGMDHGIHINVKGREPCGIVAAGAEYDDLCASIVHKLKELRDPESGSLIVRDVLHKEEIYGPGAVGSPPDLYLITNESQRPQYPGLYFPTFLGLRDSDILVSPDRHRHYGEHKREGILLAQGEEIKPGTKLQDSTIADIAPTILYSMGLGIPKDMDGKVLFDLFREDFVARHEARYVAEPDVFASDDMGALPESEQQIIEERLQGLGYL